MNRGQEVGSGRLVTPVLEARNVAFGYSRGGSVLENWSARFMAGSMTALTGASGRGKSTLLYLLGLMLRPSAGEVRVFGNDATQLKDSERANLRAHKFGFVFQDAALDATRTVLDNVTETALYRRQSRPTTESRARELLERFGVDVPAHRKPGQVSGGQAQRISLCRALLNEPPILLADEPTGNLDPTTSGLVINALRDHALAGGTVIVVTHAPEVAAASDEEIRL